MAAPIRIEDRDGVRVVRWEREDALNAMSLEMWDGTRDALDSAVADDVRCIVLTGHGRAFNVGQDLGEMADPRQADETRGYRGVMRALQEVPVPLIAAVNGLAVGFGVTLLPWCDLVLVGESARLRVPFVSLGVTTEAASSVTLPEVMGPQAAAHFVLTGDWLGADEAVATGLALRKVTNAALDDEAIALATRLAEQPPESLRTTAGLLREERRARWTAALERENAAFARLAGSPENLAAIERFFSRTKESR
jgi:enoyl-CoA hydratase/carnithine racemase